MLIKVLHSRSLTIKTHSSTTITVMVVNMANENNHTNYEKSIRLILSIPFLSKIVNNKIVSIEINYNNIEINNI